MRLSAVASSLSILAVTTTALEGALPYGIHNALPDVQKPLPDSLGPVMPHPQPEHASPPPPPAVQGGVLISDVMGRDRSINTFAGFARGVAGVAARYDSSRFNSTVLAPLNSAVEGLPRKPWEDPREYDAFGANAYEGAPGQDRANRNLERFVKAHTVDLSPWNEGQKAKSLLEGDTEIWWEMKDGVKVVSLPRYGAALGKEYKVSPVG
ncbi:hypothetical protein F4780DRAFT_304127 [Xylariomycetidae sp. FL0641]|nr:hypothetical protein F4780DRAFT_304127 [Xylariomycetidae sp. FL0641]